MSPDEMQRMMQFLLRQQVQFDANLAKVSERTEASFARLTEKTDRVAEGLIGLTSIVGQLAAAQMRADEELKEHRAQLKEQRQHIDALIAMYERHLRRDHGHGPS